MAPFRSINWHDVSSFGGMTPVTQCPVEKLVERYYQPVFRFAMRLCGDPACAMMLTQCTFRVALDRNRTLPVPANRRAWLFTLLFHRFLEARQRGLCNWAEGKAKLDDSVRTRRRSECHLLAGVLRTSRRRTAALTAQPNCRVTSLSRLFPGSASGLGIHQSRRA
jgi:DNA-directed RNA polymerase specialized sigma24 family protein